MAPREPAKRTRWTATSGSVGVGVIVEDRSCDPPQLTSPHDDQELTFVSSQPVLRELSWVWDDHFDDHSTDQHITSRRRGTYSRLPAVWISTKLNSMPTEYDGLLIHRTSPHGDLHQQSKSFSLRNGDTQLSQPNVQCTPWSPKPSRSPHGDLEKQCWENVAQSRVKLTSSIWVGSAVIREVLKLWHHRSCDPPQLTSPHGDSVNWGCLGLHCQQRLAAPIVPSWSTYRQRNIDVIFWPPSVSV